MNGANPPVAQAVSRLDQWLQTMRNDTGYCGPVAHWWQSCLLYSGPTMDWRYEGVLCGYLNLYSVTTAQVWLDRAVRAGDDLVGQQLDNGQFRNSSFEVGPVEGGTPHEAAADIGLLELAKTLRRTGHPGWTRYYQAAARNLENYHLARLWNGKAFRDQWWKNSMVPNKNATILEALILYEELSGKSMESFVQGAANWIMAKQISSGGRRQGATVHTGTGKYRLAIGIYTARCAAALLRAYQWYGREDYAGAALAMVPFLIGLVSKMGTCFGVYPDDRLITCPTWISASGDVLRALILAGAYTDVAGDAVQQLTAALLQQQTASGAIPTAYGLRERGSTRGARGLPDFRDVLPVVGWCDKSFRALSMLATDVTASEIGPSEQVCQWKGETCTFHENSNEFRLTNNSTAQLIYHWSKGQNYPNVFLL